MNKLIVSSLEEGVEKTKKVLYEKVDRRTVLFLSGGSSPKPLYQELALEKQIHPAAVALIDERYGEPMHDNSNEKMIKRTGIINYFSSEQVPFYPILQEGLSREETTEKYDATMRELFFNIPRSVAIMGVGADGHTAGIAPNREDFTNPLFHNISLLVGTFNDEKGSFKERITLTFQALTMIDYFILFVFGEEKRHALEQIMLPGSLEEIPARFFMQKENAPKTLLVTNIKE